MKRVRNVMCFLFLALGACAAAPESDVPDESSAMQPDDPAISSEEGTITPLMKCWVDDNGIKSCCQGTRCCSYIDGRWWCG